VTKHYGKEPWEMTREQFKAFQPTVPEWFEEGLEARGRARSFISQRTLHTESTLDYELPDVEQAKWGMRTYRDAADAAKNWLAEHPEYVSDHEDAVYEAVAEGKPVPLSVLQEYRGQGWADDAMIKETL